MILDVISAVAADDSDEDVIEAVDASVIVWDVALLTGVDAMVELGASKHTQADP